MVNTYTDRVKILSKILENLDSDSDEISQIKSQLKNLRKYSDIAELIGHSKNTELSIGLSTVKLGKNSELELKKEKEQFKAFKIELDEVKTKVFDLVESEKGQQLSRNDKRDIFEGVKPLSDYGLDNPQQSKPM